MDHTAHLKPIVINHPGALTAKAKRADVSLSQFEREKHTDAATRKQVTFAENAAKWKHVP